MDGEGHLGAAGYRVTDGVGVFGGDYAVIGDRKDVFALFVFVDGKDLRWEHRLFAARDVTSRRPRVAAGAGR